jgi:Zn-dependent protease with chaperone function
MLTKRIRKLYDIDPRSWEHPADTAALSVVKQIKGIDDLIKFILSITSEKSIRLMTLASTVKVTPNQYPRINTILDNVVDTFDWPYKPNVFISQSPHLNAGVLGVNEPFIIINSTLVKTFDEKELTAIIAHEMGHIMSGHALYKTVIWILTNISLKLVPMAEIIILAIVAALSEWNRKSELTADRAELLAVQEETPSYNILMRLAGAEDLTQVNLNEFFIQAQEYENEKSLLDSIHKVLNQIWMSHPYPVVRLQELKTWASSGKYETIISGTYLKRGETSSTVEEDVKNAYEYYKETIKQSDDPLSQFVSNLGDGIEKRTEEFTDRLRDFLRHNKE